MGDIRAAAQREAEKFWPSYPAAGFSGAEDRQVAFIAGAVWAQSRATPTREQIAEVLAAQREPEYRHVEDEDIGDADAVLALIHERMEG